MKLKEIITEDVKEKNEFEDITIKIKEKMNELLEELYKTAKELHLEKYKKDIELPFDDEKDLLVVSLSISYNNYSVSCNFYRFVDLYVSGYENRSFPNHLTFNDKNSKMVISNLYSAKMTLKAIESL